MPMRDEQALWCVEWGKRATEGRNYPDGFSLHKSLEDAEEYQKVNLQRSMTVTQWQGEPRVLAPAALPLSGPRMAVPRDHGQRHWRPLQRRLPHATRGGRLKAAPSSSRPR